MIKLSKRISYLSTKKNELSQNLQSTITERENKNQENIQLKKHNQILNNELHALQDEPKIIVTKDPQTRCYSDDLRTCIMDLQGIDIPSNKFSNVIKSVSNNIFHTSVDLPCRSTILNISGEGHMVAKQQVGETLALDEKFSLKKR
jgi:hypothetical protein